MPTKQRKEEIARGIYKGEGYKAEQKVTRERLKQNRVIKSSFDSILQELKWLRKKGWIKEEKYQKLMEEARKKREVNEKKESATV